MNLIMVLIALGVETWLGSFDRYRNLAWFTRYCNRLEAALAGIAFWNGAGGLLLTLFIPLALLGVLVFLAGKVHFILGFLLSLAALIYSFGPAVNALVNRYIEALGSNDEGVCREILGQLLPDAPAESDDLDHDPNHDQIIGAIMLRSHDYLFAVIFWFLLLGAVGALMYCLVANLADRHEKTDSAYAAATRDLHNILMWPSARLLAVGFALGGSLVSALESWRTVSGHTLDVSREVITVSGFGALHHTPADEAETEADNERFSARLRETMALINRTLIVWLIVLGLMTIAGYIS